MGAAGASDTVASVYKQWFAPHYQDDGTYETPGKAVAALGALGKDVVFSEIGYQQCQGAAAAPSTQPDASNPSSCGETTYDPAEQQTATQAAYCYWSGWARSNGEPSWFHGLWWWDWDLSGPQYTNVWDLRAGANGGAESVIRSWNTNNGSTCPEATR